MAKTIILDGKEYELVPCYDTDGHNEPDLEDERASINTMADFFADNDWTYFDGEKGTYTPDEYALIDNIKRNIYDIENSEYNFIESGRFRIEKDDELDGYYRVRLIAEEFVIKSDEVDFLKQ